MVFHQSITAIKGIGPVKAAALKRLNIETIADLLEFYPRDYEDRREIKTITSLFDGENALVKGTILLIVKGKNRNRKKQTLKLLVQDHTGSMEVVFFHAGYLEKSLLKNEPYVFFGKVSVVSGKVQMLHPDFSKCDTESEQSILPVYRLTSGLTQSDFRKWQKMVMQDLEEIPDCLSEPIRLRNRLCGFQYALENIHFPKDRQHLMEAKYRLIFEELLLLQTGLLTMKNRTESARKGISFSNTVFMREYTEKLPYQLTHAQERVLSEINRDMGSDKVMNRLVQGDVGSGKTAVAAASLFKAAKSGYQAAFMAPTELLAKQHYNSLKKELAQFDIQVGFLSGSVAAKEKRTVLQQLQAGELDVLIGTHAILQPNVIFKRLGLAITDEQHRFGVNQRMILTEKGENPDILVMTATPIPRTLAVILYGDLDISIIDEMPPGRQSIITRAVGAGEREISYEFIRREVKEGKQAYVVAPLIEESENLDVKSALGLYDELKGRFEGFSIAFLHGSMKQAEKDFIMQEFYNGSIDILVSTVVIEVGINVPNATIMLIENAERFGLSQLHQLRGRVGRGEEQSYCILITDTDAKIANERAEIMKSTNDGFVIAEKDLELRGPGEFFGMKQHGVPEFKLADLVKHIKILSTVREEAALILAEDPFLTGTDTVEMKAKIERMFLNTGKITI